MPSLVGKELSAGPIATSFDLTLLPQKAFGQILVWAEFNEFIRLGTAFSQFYKVFSVILSMFKNGYAYNYLKSRKTGFGVQAVNFPLPLAFFLHFGTIATQPGFLDLLT